MSAAAAVRDAFSRRFGGPPPFVVRAPGRVNLIGEHTDYNAGFVLPMAIDRWVSIALAPRADGSVRMASLELEDSLAFSLADPGPRGSGWGHYAKGTAWALAQAGFALRGWDGVLSGDVPMGAGLSSSAAFEMAVARAFACVSGFAWEPKAMALAAQRAENAWVGVGCGIMDQLISGCGRAGHAMLLDCRSLETRAVPLPAGTTVAILDTATRRSLSHSGYNERRGQCERASAAIGVEALRDVSVAQLESLRRRVDDTLFRRARHVVTENDRTLAAAGVLAAGDAAAMGRLMDESHGSLRDDFEVSTPPIEAMVRAAREAPGCLGARMTGGGFGGCVVALVESDAVAAFEPAVVGRYRRETGLEPRLYVCRATDGAEVL